MAEARSDPRLERNARLVVADCYEREVGASLERVWENVDDWEHLPWLHDQAFDAIERIDSGRWGWHCRVELPKGRQAEIELVTDRAARRYVARTLSGEGAPTEIWTTLDPVAADRTAIRVEFCIEPTSEAVRERIGERYVSIYTRLWDQDEEMMQGRERALAERRALAGGGATGGDAAPPEALDLGPWEAVRTTLPREVEVGGRRFRLVELDGAPVLHSVVCPHRLGPLEDCPVEAGVVTCPWHGYRFDLRTGRSADGRGLSLPAAPRATIDPESGRIRLT